MIQEFVDKFMENRGRLGEKWRTQGHPGGYEDILKEVILAINGGETKYGLPDHERIHVIDDGDYQGTLLFVIGAGGYQPDSYWATKVAYGSCSGCDTFQSIADNWSGEETPETQIEEYLLLALHMVQQLKEL